MYYIQELKKTLNQWELDFWGELIQTGEYFSDVQVEMGLCFQQIQEIKNIEGIKEWLSTGNTSTKKEVQKRFDDLFLQTKTLSN